MSSISAISNRIVRHVEVRAGDLIPHEHNPRIHPAAQRKVLLALYREVGFARSLLAYELPDGKLKLIDGHLRRDLDPDMVVTVEVLDVNDEEARKLLLSIDPLAGLASLDEQRLEALRRITCSTSDELTNLWQSIGDSRATLEQTLETSRTDSTLPASPAELPGSQFLVLVECADEATQLALLERFTQEGLLCRALVS